jgi:hypothetical protein
VILWQLAQLVFWLAVMVAIVIGFAVVALAPPYLAARYLRHRLA